jgi:hypothetical protein
MTTHEPSPDEYAVSPAIGPVPAIYVHLSPKHAHTERQHVPIGGTMSDIPADLRNAPITCGCGPVPAGWSGSE